MNQKDTSGILLENYKVAPKAVQTFISSGALDKFIQETQAKYKLHIDVAGRLSNEILLVLLGVTDPNELPKNVLNEALISEADFASLFKDINDWVFLPIRQQIRKETAIEGRRGVMAASPAYTVPTKSAAAMPLRSATPVPGTAPVQAGPGHFHLENKLPNHPPQQAVPKAPAPPPAVPAPQPAEGRKLLEDHEEPSIDIKLDKTAVPPNLPGVPHQAVPAPAPIPPLPPASYSVDPYREPIDDK